MREQIRRFFSYNWLSTLRINFRLLPFGQARKLPILVQGRIYTTFGPHTRLVLTNEHVTRGMLILGSMHEMVTVHGGQSMLTLLGSWELGGELHLGIGSNLYVAEGAVLTSGDGIYIGGNSKIDCFEHVRLGNNVLAGEIYISDTSAHPVMHHGKLMPMTKPIEVGDGCYFGFRTMVLRGCHIPPRCVIASGAVCTRQFTEPETLLAGVPAEVKERNVTAVTKLSSSGQSV